jgi:hypothetical protein
VRKIAIAPISAEDEARRRIADAILDMEDGFKRYRDGVAENPLTPQQY